MENGIIQLSQMKRDENYLCYFVTTPKDPPLFSNAIHRATRRPNRASPEAFPGGPGDGASEELRDLARNVWEIAARDLKASEPGMYVGQKFLE